MVAKTPKEVATAKASPASKAVAPKKTTIKAPASTAPKSASKKTTTANVTSESKYGTGRRKNAVARVWVKPGTGKFSVNGKALEEYFSRPVLRMIISQPFDVTKTTSGMDVFCTVKGGGLSGQAGAIRHGISRALDKLDAVFHGTLRQGGFLTRDSRVVERKKYGRAKARKRFQFSKR